MSFWRLVLAGARYHARMHVAVALGVAAATAIVVGALEIGASMRSSLAEMTIQRLGAVDEAAIATGWFRDALADEVASSPVVREDYAGALPVVWFPQTTVQRQDDPDLYLGDVALWGVPPEFWKLSADGESSERKLGRDEIVLNDVAAKQLGIAARGDAPQFVLVRVPDELGVPEEASLGRKDRRAITIARLRVVDVLPSEGVGRFGLFPTQIAGPIAFVDRSFLQNEIDHAGESNVLLVAGKDPRRSAGMAAHEALQNEFAPKLADLGFRLSHERRTFPAESAANETPQTVYDYYSLTSDKLLIPPDAEKALREKLASLDALPTFTYLANYLEVVDDAPPGEKPSGIPYSLVTGIPLGEGFPLLDVDGKAIPPLGDDEIVLNSWAAEDLKVGVGAKLRLSYFLPESIEGENEEAAKDFVVKAITPLTEPATGWRRERPPVYEQAPTLANDQNLTPEAPGLTDRESIEEWDPPFDMTRETRSADDAYWTNHRTTPKAFVSAGVAKELWGSRFGDVSSYRIPAKNVDNPEKLAREFAAILQRDAAQSRLAFRPVKLEGLYASSGSTPFDVLFLMLSMFILGSALALVFLLFQLGLEMRFPEVGLLAAVGWTRRKIGLAFLAEGAIVATVGAALGVALGVGYALLMIFALTTWWIGAIATTDLAFHFDWVSVVAGFLGGLVASCGTIAWATLRTRGQTVRALLRGGRDDRAGRAGKSLVRRAAIPAGVVAIVGGVGLAGFAVTLGGMEQAGAFLGGGALLLVGGLAIAWGWLRAEGGDASGQSFGWNRFLLESARRNPGRSVLTISSVAVAAFLVIGVSAFQMAPTRQGTGGFDFVATVDRPIFENPLTPAGRKTLFPTAGEALDAALIVPMRHRRGDDASCNNLYQVARPQAWGVPKDAVGKLDETGSFAFGAVEPGFEERPWAALEQKYESGVPVILDRNTAMYSLKLYGGIGETFEVDYGSGQVVTFRVTGLLADTILQGGVLLSEQDFVELFPESPGYRFFLVEAPAGDGRSDAVAEALRKNLASDGITLTDADERLAGFLAVQNTYLQTFQSLGALGLLLGAFGVAAAQMRNVFERRRELALLRAVGFSKGRVGSAVLTENLALLAVGLALGGVAAGAAALPQVFLRGLDAPWAAIGSLAIAVVGVGVVTSWLATRFLFRLPLLTALRGE